MTFHKFKLTLKNLNFYVTNKNPFKIILCQKRLILQEKMVLVRFWTNMVKFMWEILKTIEKMVMEK